MKDAGLRFVYVVWLVSESCFVVTQNLPVGPHHISMLEFFPSVTTLRSDLVIVSPLGAAFPLSTAGERAMRGALMALGGVVGL